MQIVKQSVARDIPCILVEASDGQTPDTGVVAGSTTISYRKEGATSWSAKTATGNWTEVGKGVYLISWSTTDLNTIGRFDFVVEVSADINYYGSLVVSANLLDDLDTTLDALNDVSANDVRDAILDDATRFSGADIDTAITSRSSHTANNVRDAILSDSTAFAGGNINATISSRSSHAAADVVALMNDLDATEILAALTTDSTKWAGGNIDVAISTRSSHSAADVIALLNDPTVAAIVTGIWTEAQAGYTTPGTFGYFLDLQVSAAGGGAAPTVAQIAEAVHDVKVTFNKTTGGLVITMADDTPLTSVTITDTAGEVTRE